MSQTSFGRYEIRSEIGRGGMAVVYRGFDPEIGRDIAIKVLPREFLDDPQFRERFRREARIIAMLEHPAIVPIYDFGEAEGQPYFVMRFMPGGSLTDKLAKGPLALTEAARVVAQVAPALDDAHAKGIVHRDLKPGNILFDQHNLPYVSDFGIAKITESTVATLTGSSLIGTPAYMSPEQAKGEKNLDGRADNYALGAIIFEMLTGQFPYKADTPMGLAMKHVTAPVPRILNARPDLPPDCQEVIDRAMAKDRNDRAATAAEIAEVLDAVAHGRPIPSRRGAATVFERPVTPPTVLDRTASTLPRAAPPVPPQQRGVPPPVFHQPQPPPAPPPVAYASAPPAAAPRHGVSIWLWIMLGLCLFTASVAAGLFLSGRLQAIPQLLNPAPPVSSPTPAPSATLPSQPTTDFTVTNNAAILLTANALGTLLVPSGTPDLTLTASACVYAYTMDSIDPPQGTPIAAGQLFTLTITLRNAGACAWPKGTTLALLKGDQLSAPSMLGVTPLDPNAEGKIEIAMQSPKSGGTAAQVWELHLPDGRAIGQPMELTYTFAEPPTATPTPRPATTAPTRTPAPTATNTPASAGPFVIRRVNPNPSATRTGTGNDAALTASLEFTGGTGPFTVWDDSDPNNSQTRNIAGTFTDGGITYNYLLFNAKSSCGASFASTVHVTDNATGQSVNYPYFVKVTCP